MWTLVRTWYEKKLGVKVYWLGIGIEMSALHMVIALIRNTYNGVVLKKEYRKNNAMFTSCKNNAYVECKLCIRLENASIFNNHNMEMHERIVMH